MTVDIGAMPVGVGLLAEGRFHDALEPLRLALSKDDAAPAAMLNLAIAEDRAGNQDRGRRLMQQVAVRMPGEPPVPATLRFIDARHQHGVLLGFCIPEAAAEEGEQRSEKLAPAPSSWPAPRLSSLVMAALLNAAGTEAYGTVSWV